MIFENLGEETASKLYNEFKAQGLSDEEAFSEVYSIECNMDNE